MLEMEPKFRITVYKALMPLIRNARVTASTRHLVNYDVIRLNSRYLSMFSLTMPQLFGTKDLCPLIYYTSFISRKGLPRHQEPRSLSRRWYVLVGPG